MREVLLLDCALYTTHHVIQTHRYFPLLATNHGLELQHKLKNASGSYGREGNTERGWGGEPCEDKDKITPLTTVSFYLANLNHSPDNEEGQISIGATHKACTPELLPGPSVHSAACSCPSSFSVVTGMSCTKNISEELRCRWFQSTQVISMHVIKLKSLGTVVWQKGVHRDIGYFTDLQDDTISCFKFPCNIVIQISVYY